MQQQWAALGSAAAGLKARRQRGLGHGCTGAGSAGDQWLESAGAQSTGGGSHQGGSEEM